MLAENRVYFAIDGDFNVDEWTRLIGIEPTRVIRKGTIHARLLAKESSWMIERNRRSDEYMDVYELADEIVTLLGPSKDAIREFCQELDLNVRLQVVIWFVDDPNLSTPALGFSNKVLCFLADIGAYIDVDTYLD
ncbi:MAG: DUF4279 domain-containing protein [Acidobacteria bacterium]|nr:DUF4279 domain-containing protein [Acidobacteriota bacterium]